MTFCKQFSLSSLFLFLFYFFPSVLPAQTVRINEVMSSNASTITDEDSDFNDWIELYNQGPSAVNLSGHGLSDNSSQPFKWTFPNVTIASGEYLLVWASGKNRTAPGSPLHTNFSIGAEGEDILLTHPNEGLIDTVEPVAIPSDMSYGRQPDGNGGWYFFNAPTPGSTNTTSTGYEALLQAPSFSHSGGFYNASFSLNITADPDAIILYTLDSSDPDEANLAGVTYTYKNQYPQNPGNSFGPILNGSYRTFSYTAPLSITDRSTEQNRLTGRSSTYDQSPWYAPASPVFKGTVIRARAVKGGHMPSEIVTHTFFVTPEAQARYTLPVVSISMQENLLFGYEEGIYTAGKTFDDWRTQNPGAQADGGVMANYHRDGDAAEYPGHVEIFDPQAGTIIDQRMGMRIHGGWSRSFPTKSLRLYARNEYGKSHFDYPLFSERSSTEYKRLLLRNSGNDWDHTYFRDAAIQAVASPLNIDRQAYRPAVVFLNGEYWGLLNMRERYDKHYLNRMYGVDAENLDILENNRTPDEGDAAHYNATISYIQANGLVQDQHYEHIKTRIDVDNFIDYQIIQIFARNTDWPGNNIKFWRLKTSQYQPGAPYGHDGRWRWMLYDTDFGFGIWDNTYTHNTLAFAAQSNGPDWPNPPWSTFLFRELLKNEKFKTAFINRFDDMLNSAFLPERTTAIVNEMKQAYVPEMAEHIARWKVPSSVNTWNNRVNVMLNFVQQRPAYQRQHIRNYFGLGADINLTVNVSDPQHGHVRVNTLEIKSSTPGLSENPYPFSGAYFRGVPMEVEAIPAPGYRFAGWEGIAGGNTAKIQFTPEGNISLTAHFVQGESTQLMHYWNFNDTGALQEPTYTTEGAAITVTEGPSTEVTDGNGNGFSGENVRLGDNTGTHLRINNPLGAGILFTLPTTGYKDIVLKYETRRSGQGAGIQVVEYTTDGVSFEEFETLVIIDGDPVLYTFDFTEVEAANDNPDFAVRITFEQGTGSTVGNNRFDNVTVDGAPLEGTNVPPIVAQPAGLITLIEGGENHVLDLNTVFTDVNGDLLTYTVTSSAPDFVVAEQVENTLTLTPLRRGDATITLLADDGQATPVSHVFRVLVYPEAFVLRDADFTFGQWSSDHPERTYPDHMIFLQSDIADPRIDYPLLYPYYVAHDDYHADDEATIGFPYKSTGRSRLNGLGDEGISFINTGRGRDLGGALLAINTEDLDAVHTNWLCATLLQNARVYGIDLQYRIGTEGAFINVPDAGYVTGTDGHTRSFSSVQLPADVLGHPYVQLLWRYHHLTVTSGPRAQLRLDDIVVAGTQATVVSTDNNIQAEGRIIYPNPVADETFIQFTLKRESKVTITVTDMMGRAQHIVANETLGQGSHERILNTSAFSQGSYIVTIQTATGTTHHKIIKYNP